MNLLRGRARIGRRWQLREAAALVHTAERLDRRPRHHRVDAKLAQELLGGLHLVEPAAGVRSRPLDEPAEEGIVDVANSIHVGCRGPVDIERIAGTTRGHGYALIDARDFFRRGHADAIAPILKRLAGRPVYLCFDMDFFDPSVAPGVCTPTWGGATAREGIELLRSLVGLRLVAIDVNTVSPPHDFNGQTAFLAAQIMLEAMALIARGRRNRPAD